MDERILRRAFADISKGYSTIWLNEKPAYVLHFNLFNQVSTDEEYQKAYRIAKKRARTEEEALAAAKKAGKWTAKDEQEITNCRRSIDAFEANARVAAAPSQLRQLKQQIKEERERLSKKLEEKADILGVTCEIFANRRANAFYVYSSLFKEPGLQIPLYGAAEFDDLEDEELNAIIKAYNECMEPCGSEGVNMIAASGFFQNVFQLSETPYHFYGKPLVQLSFSQIELVSAGRRFQRIFQELGDKMPSSIANDPAKIVDWATTHRNFEHMMEKMGDHEHIGLANFTQEDLKELGIDKNQDNTFEKMRKAGKKVLTMEDQIGMKV